MKPRARVLPLFIPHLGCRHECVYCDQRRISGRRESVTGKDVAAALAALSSPVDEMAFYGGSFTALPRSEQAELLAAARPFVENGTAAGIRISTRPDAIDGETLAFLQDRHVKTIELGAQSMDDGVLARCARGHTAEDTVRAARQVKEWGFRLILQMMTGLPGSDDALDLITAERLAALRPDGVRVYPAVILRGTPLYALWKRGAYREHTVEDAVRVCARLLPVFQKAGIPVIRLGLNPTEELSGGAAAGGAYHPALGELVRSRVYLEKAREALRGAEPGTDATIFVCKNSVSQMTGQCRCNVETLKAEFQLRSLRIAAAEVPEGEVLLAAGSC